MYSSLIDRIDKELSSPSDESSSDSDDWDSSLWDSDGSDYIKGKGRSASETCTDGSLATPQGQQVPRYAQSSEASPVPFLAETVQINIHKGEELAMNFISATDVPVLSIMRDMNLHHISKLLSSYSVKFSSTQEQALILTVLLDFVSCCSQPGLLLTAYEPCKTPERLKKHVTKLLNGLYELLGSSKANELSHLKLQSIQKIIGASVNRLPLDLKNGFSFLQNVLHQKISKLETEEKSSKFFPMYNFSTEDDFKTLPVKTLKKKSMGGVATCVNSLHQEKVKRKKSKKKKRIYNVPLAHDGYSSSKTVFKELDPMSPVVKKTRKSLPDWSQKNKTPTPTRKDQNSKLSLHNDYLLPGSKSSKSSTSDKHSVSKSPAEAASDMFQLLKGSFSSCKSYEREQQQVMSVTPKKRRYLDFSSEEGKELEQRMDLCNKQVLNSESPLATSRSSFSSHKHKFPSKKLKPTNKSNSTPYGLEGKTVKKNPNYSDSSKDSLPDMSVHISQVIQSTASPSKRVPIMSSKSERLKLPKKKENAWIESPTKTVNGSCSYGLTTTPKESSNSRSESTCKPFSALQTKGDNLGKPTSGTKIVMSSFQRKVSGVEAFKTPNSRKTVNGSLLTWLKTKSFK